MKLFLLFSILYLQVSVLLANNLQLGVPTVSGDEVSFTIQWDNSWRVVGGPANYDAVWIFLKYQICNDVLLTWDHVGLSTTSGDHSVTGGVLEVLATTDGKGVFIQRSSAGNGNISSATVTLKMSITDANYNFQLHGVEMVYIPQGDFYIGDGSRGGSAWGFSNGGASTPLQITSAIQTAGLNVNQYQTSNFGSNLLNTFPMGYNAFYTMKYEISQEQYVQMLNSLTYAQQANRFAVSNLSAPGTLVLATATNCRNGIRIKTSGILSNIPAVVGCDLDGDGTFDEADDGQNIACGWLSWADLMAYLDWSALRPMTEFEFEKICRGIIAPVSLEYPWGSTTILQAHSGALNNAGTANEVSTASGNGLCAYGINTTTNRGPLRCGFAPSSTTTREQAGATYYGVMDMAGNVEEQCIGGYNGYNYGTFTTDNGDGTLNVAGAANTANWPVLGGAQGPAPNGGGICRGGNWYHTAGYCRTSNRDWMTTNTNQTRWSVAGGRGVRSY